MNYKIKSLEEHFDPTLKPKRILTLDGGGVRGVVSLAFLEKIEEILKAKHGNNSEFRLCHYFDLIAGTSTGAIIAAALAWGHPVEFIKRKYFELATEVFERSRFRGGYLRYKFDKKVLENVLKDPEVFGGENTRLGSPDIKTGLMIIAKRYDTCSPWPLWNNPNGKFYKMLSDNISNADFPLWKVVRASTAAPSYFKPEKIEVARETINGNVKTVGGLFVDGGVSTANNPALQTFMATTLKGFNLYWDKGKDNILLISVGTGLRGSKLKTSCLPAKQAVNSLISMMNDCNDHVETIMQWISHSDTKREIDMEIGNLAGDRLCEEPALTYQRFNVIFSSNWMQANLAELNYQSNRLKRFEKMDDPRNLDDLERIGNLAATKQIYNQHFPDSFNLQ